MREPDLVWTDCEGQRRLATIELPEDATDLALITLGLGHFGAAHAFRIDVIAKAKEHRRPQEPIIGPVLVLHLRDHLRLHPDRRAVKLRLVRERTRVAPQRLEPFFRLCKSSGNKSGGPRGPGKT